MPQPKKTAKHKRKGQHARIARLLAKHPHYLAVWKEADTPVWHACASESCDHVVKDDEGVRRLQEFVQKGACAGKSAVGKMGMGAYAAAKFTHPREGLELLGIKGLKNLLRALEFTELRRHWQRHGQAAVPDHMKVFKDLYADFGKTVAMGNLKNGVTERNYEMVFMHSWKPLDPDGKFDGTEIDKEVPKHMQACRFLKFDDFMSLPGGGKCSALASMTLNQCIAAVGVCLEWHTKGHFEASKPSANLVKLWENMRAGSYFSGMRTIADAVNEAKGGPGASGENATDNDRSFTAKQINGIVNALLFPVWRMSCAYNGCKQVEEFELRGAHGQDPLMLTKPNESGGIGAATGYLAFLGAEMKRWKAGEPQYSGKDQRVAMKDIAVAWGQMGSQQKDEWTAKSAKGSAAPSVTEIAVPPPPPPEGRSAGGEGVGAWGIKNPLVSESQFQGAASELKQKQGEQSTVSALHSELRQMRVQRDEALAAATAAKLLAEDRVKQRDHFHAKDKADLERKHLEVKAMLEEQVQSLKATVAELKQEDRQEHGSNPPSAVDGSSAQPSKRKDRGEEATVAESSSAAKHAKGSSAQDEKEEEGAAVSRSGRPRKSALHT